MKDELTKIAAAMREYAAKIEAMAVEPEKPHAPKPPPGYRLATEDERKCLPEGAKIYSPTADSWRDSDCVGMAHVARAAYAVPDTFEAHGKTWTRHTPGDAMPCDAESMVSVIYDIDARCQTPDRMIHNSKEGKMRDWMHAVGWRYADEKPDPWAKEKEAFRQGKVIQYTDGTMPQWDDINDPMWVSPDHDFQPRYRIKPSLKMVPLGPDDVLPGSVIISSSAATSNGARFMQVTCAKKDGVEIGRRDCIPWDELMQYWQINRSIPLTGKWDANAWEPCSKCEKEEAE